MAAPLTSLLGSGAFQGIRFTVARLLNIMKFPKRFDKTGSHLKMLLIASLQKLFPGPLISTCNGQNHVARRM